MPYNKKFMLEAIRVANENIENQGGPFGAVIVKDGKIIAASGNSVTTDNDPTAHAEVNTIRKACKQLGTFNLEGCEIYSSCEPCPMCLSAIYWAHIDKLYYATTKDDAASIGFDDSFIYHELTLKPEQRRVKAEQHDRDIALEPFIIWQSKTDKTEY
jgi:tRNA(Arg) A34 adenosine deaminase TadA